MRATKLDISIRYNRQFDLVKTANKELGEAGDERNFTSGSQPDTSGDHILLGNSGLKVAVRLVLGENFGECRILNVAVKGNNAWILANGCKSNPVCFAG